MPRWRKNSVFAGSEKRQPLDREQRAQWKGRLRWLYRLGRITAKALLIGEAMVDFLGPDGRLDPSHAAVAERAHAGARTVRRALATLSDLGMLRWVRRLVRDGSYVEQTSNSYELLLPDSSRIGGGQNGRGTRTKILSSASAVAMRAAKDALKGVLGALTVPSAGKAAADRAALARVRAVRAGWLAEARR